MKRLHWVGVAALVVLASGCPAADGGFFGAEEEGGDTGNATSLGDETASGGDAGEEGDPTEAECGDCGPGGSCFFDGEDSFCICGDGFEPGVDPTECVACASLDSADIDMDIVDLEGVITVNDAPPPASVFDSGELYLSNPVTGDEVFLGDTADGVFSARVLAGRYDVVYRSDGTAKETVPSNTHAVLKRVRVDGEAALTEIDVPARSVLVELSVDGEAAPAVEVDDAVLRLVPPEGDDEVVLGRTSGNPSARVVPGDYRVVYSADTVGDKMPADTWRKLPELHEIEPPGPEETTALIEVSIETEAYDPQVTLNGAPFPAVESDDGVLWLVDAENRIALGRTSSSRSPVRVITGGLFSLYYAADSVGESAPANRWARLQPDVAANETVAVQAYWVAPVLEVDGQPAPDSEVDDAELWLVDPFSGDEAPLGVTSGTVGTNVIAGQYDLQYRAQTVGELMPANTRATLSVIGLDADFEETVIATTLIVDGAITVGGEPAPDEEFASGRITLERGEDKVLLGKTSAGAYARRVLAGDYDIYYAVELPGSELPANEHAPVVFGYQLDADQTLPIDIPSRELAGSLTIEQSSVPSSPADTGRLYLRASSVGDGASIGDVGEQSYSIAVVPGSYSIYYRSDASSGVTPGNTNGRVGCFTVE